MMDQGGYYNSQSYEGYGHYMSQQGYYNAPSISPCTIQAPPPNNYYDPQQYQNPQFASYDQYSQYSHNYNPPQHPFPPQDYSQISYPSPIHYTPYPQGSQPPYDHYNHSPSVGSYGIDEETLALARRWGVTIVPDDDIEDDGYPMRPSEEEYANNQWEPQEPFYQEPPQASQPIDEETRSMMNNLIIQMNMLQAQLDDLKSQEKGLATQEPIQELFSNGEVLQELLLPNEGHVGEANEETGEDLEDKDDEVHDECIEMETPSWGESIELQGNGDKEQLEVDPSGEMLKNDIVDEICGTNEVCPSLDDTPLGENFRLTWEPGGVNVFECGGPHWPIFMSKDSYFILVHKEDPRFSLLAQEKENRGENKNGFDERICLNFEFMEEQCLSFKVVDLCIKEFVDGHHVRHYLEEKFARKDGMFFLQSNDG